MPHKTARRLATALCASLAFAIMLPAASALQIVAKGEFILVGGPIKPGDSIAFRQFYQQAPRGTYRYVYLASGGGFVAEAIEIGRLVRAEGLSTIVDARKAVCASACTAIFIAGRQRFYLNAPEASDLRQRPGRGGLGFHDGNSAVARGPDRYSGAATALMISAYHEFGVPGAATLITKAAPDRLFVVSGPEALQLGIATSLGRDARKTP